MKRKMKSRRALRHMPLPRFDVHQGRDKMCCRRYAGCGHRLTATLARASGCGRRGCLRGRGCRSVTTKAEVSPRPGSRALCFLPDAPLILALKTSAKRLSVDRRRKRLSLSPATDVSSCDRRASVCDCVGYVDGKRGGGREGVKAGRGGVAEASQGKTRRDRTGLCESRLFISPVPTHLLGLDALPQRGQARANVVQQLPVEDL